MSGVSDHHMNRFVVAEEEKPKVYETERNLLHETLDKRKLSPSSSAWQSEGFVNLRSRVRVPLRALIVVFSDNGNAGASIGGLPTERYAALSMLSVGEELSSSFFLLTK